MAHNGKLPAGATAMVDRLDPRDNALNLVRLVLAGLVIVSHASPIGGLGEEIHLGDLKLGTFAVGGFFAISGYLITRSRFHLGIIPYLWRRALRILPGLWLCLIITAFVMAPVVGIFRGGWSFAAAAHYVTSYAAMLGAGGRIGETLVGAPFPENWNGSLWTLFYEFVCYLLVGLAAISRWFRRTRWAMLVWFVAATVGAELSIRWSIPGIMGQLLLLLPFFLAGAVLLQYSDRILLTKQGALLAAVVVGATMAAEVGRVLAPLPLAYLCLWAGATAPACLRRIGARNDISYGVYLYGFPVEQLLVTVGSCQLGLPAFTVLSLAAVLPFAWLSWLLVEKPAMRLRSVHFPGKVLRRSGELFRRRQRN